MKGRYPVLFVILNGELGGPPARLRRLAREAAAVLCADGGIRHAAALGLKPQIVIGDMDSLPAPLPAWRGVAYLCDFDESLSDFEKALRFALKRGFREAWVAGALGGRIDHVMVNLALAERYAARLPVRFVGGAQAHLLAPGRHVLRAARGAAITLLPATPSARVTASGLRYPLKAETLERGSRGLSNIALSPKCRLLVHSGLLWFVCAQPNDPLRRSRKKC